MEIEGTVFNLSFDNEKIIRGWWLLIDESNNEYLVRQNFFLFGLKQYKFNRKIYKVNQSLRKYSFLSEKTIKKAQEKNNKSYIGLGLAIPIGAVLRNVIPFDWLWGASNLPIDYGVGFVNLIIFWLSLIISLKIVSNYRKKKFEKKIKEFGMNLTEFGTGYAISPLRTTQNILKWW
ncbi:hypothetical protein [uncultured Vagococcus sp.]|uniref:hypothetical protein n=1 Tax=uncultured Vagococcus sp. TaxID=189676 RepID=UPI0028D09A5F|nr:hypothetical protein [uncultured Vagococcus sp.]